MDHQIFCSAPAGLLHLLRGTPCLLAGLRPAVATLPFSMSSSDPVAGAGSPLLAAEVNAARYAWNTQQARTRRSVSYTHLTLPTKLEV